MKGKTAAIKNVRIRSTILARASFNNVEEPGRSDLCVNHLSDEELVAQCARGSRPAMDVLVSRYHGKLLDFAFRHLRDRELSADIAQTTLVRVFESAGSYRVKALFKTWLYTIALNLIRDECRRRRARKESLSSELEGSEALLETAAGRTDAGSSPERAVLERASASELWGAVGRLGENPRSAMLLKFRDGLTYEEIGDVMGVPAGTVKSWIHHALRALRESLKPAECEV